MNIVHAFRIELLKIESEESRSWQITLKDTDAKISLQFHNLVEFQTYLVSIIQELIEENQL